MKKVIFLLAILATLAACTPKAKVTIESPNQDGSDTIYVKRLIRT